MTANVNFATGANFEEGKAILSPLIQEIANATDAQVGLESEASKLGFVIGDAITPDGEITSMVGPEPLRRIDEDGTAPLVTIMQGYTKKYKMDSYALKHKCTQVFAKWIEQGSQVANADASVRKELESFKEAVERLVDGSTLTLNEVMTKVFTKGFSTTAAFGPGSALGDGQPLFSASHVVKKTGGTFTNIATGALTATNLESTIELYKSQVRTPNGYRIKTPSIFDLIVPRTLETTARKMLNSNGDQAGVYAGTGSNANLLNVFSFQGSKVRLTVLDMVGENDADGVAIGLGTMWFLANNEYNLKYKSFRVFRLWDNYITMWKNDETDSIFTKLSTHFVADAYNAEGIMGYAG